MKDKETVLGQKSDAESIVRYCLCIHSIAMYRRYRIEAHAASLISMARLKCAASRVYYIMCRLSYYINARYMPRTRTQNRQTTFLI